MALRRLEPALSSCVGPRRVLGPVSTPAPLLSDNFTDVDGTLLSAHKMNTGSGWTDLNGQGILQSGQAKYQADAPNTDSNASYTTSPASDFALSVRINLPLGGAAGVLVRLVDFANYYLLRIGEATNVLPGCSIYQRVAGTYTQVALQASAPAPGWHTLAATVRGPVIVMACDFTTILSYTSATLNPTAKKIALISDQAATLFDDFQVLP